MLLAKLHETQTKNATLFAQRAFGIIDKVKKDEENNTDVDKEVDYLRQALADFAMNDAQKTTTMPEGLSKEELNSVEKLAKEFKLKFNIRHTHYDGKMEYVLSKE